jgi:hypothetical protein
MFQVQLSFVVNLSNVFLVWIPRVSLFVTIPVVCISCPTVIVYLYVKARIIITIIIIIIIFVVTFMQGIYSYIPQTNHVYRVCSVAAVLYLQFMLHVMLSRTLNMFCTLH